MKKQQFINGLLTAGRNLGIDQVQVESKQAQLTYSTSREETIRLINVTYYNLETEHELRISYKSKTSNPWSQNNLWNIIGDMHRMFK